MPTSPPSSRVRERILETAAALFNAHGLRAVGIDLIIAQAGVAKMSLYKHFPTKNDLILEVLRLRDMEVELLFRNAIQRHRKRGIGGLDAFFLALKDWMDSPDFRGCSFINASIELAEPDHAGFLLAREHKTRMHGLIHELITQAAGPEVARRTSGPVGLLVEGAIVMAVLQGNSQPAVAAHGAAKSLVEGPVDGRPRRRRTGNK